MIEIMKIRHLILIVFNFDCICCQNFSLKAKFILDFFNIYIDYITWVYSNNLLYMF